MINLTILLLSKVDYFHFDYLIYNCFVFQAINFITLVLSKFNLSPIPLSIIPRLLGAINLVSLVFASFTILILNCLRVNLTYR